MNKLIKLILLLFVTFHSTANSSESDDQLLNRISKPLVQQNLTKQQLSLVQTQGLKIFNEYVEYLARRADYHHDFATLLQELRQSDAQGIRQGIISIYGFEKRELDNIQDKFFQECLLQALDDHQKWTTQYSENLLKPVLKCSEVLGVLLELKNLLCEGIEFYKNNTEEIKQEERNLRNLQKQQIRKDYGINGSAVIAKSNGLSFFFKHTFKENADFIAEFGSFVKQIDLLLKQLQKTEVSKPKKQNRKKNANVAGKRKKGKKQSKVKAKAKAKAKGIKAVAAKTYPTVEEQKLFEEDADEAHGVNPSAHQVEEQAIADPLPHKSMDEEFVDEINPQTLIESWIGELVEGRLSIRNYHKRLQDLYAAEKNQASDNTHPERNNNNVVEQDTVICALAKDHFDTLSSIYAYSKNIKWQVFEAMITSENGLKGTVTSNSGGSAATIRFPHPFKEGAYVQFVLHKPHPGPNLYDDLCKRFIKNLGYYGLTQKDFRGE